MADSSVHAESTMAQVLEAFPGARRALFRKYHIGGCQSCGFEPEETLAQLCERNGGLAVQELIGEIQAGHQQDQAMELSPADLDARRKNGDTMRLLDIRTSEEFDAVRIDGAEFVNQELIQQLMGTVGKDDLIVFYDHTGGQSLDAAAYFVGHGFTNAKYLSGGIDAWAREVDTNMRRYRLEPTS